MGQRNKLAGRLSRSAGISFLLFPVGLLVFLVLRNPETRALLSVCAVLVVVLPGIHEIGHLLGARLVGFCFEFFTVGPLMIARQGKRLRVNLMFRPDLPTGLAAAVPTNDNNLRARLAVAVAGGPLTNLLLAGFALILFVRLGYRQGHWTPPLLDDWWSLTLFETVVLSLLLFVMSIVPMGLGGFAADGERLFVLLSGGVEAERYCSLVALGRRDWAGLRPREWPPDLVHSVAAGPADGSAFDATGTMFGYYWSLDRGDVVGAEDLLNRLLSVAARRRAAHSSLIFLEAAYFFARYRRDQEAACTFWGRARCDQRHMSATAARAAAAIHLAAGRCDAAREWARFGLAAAERIPATGVARAEADWLQEVASGSEAGAPSVRPMPKPEGSMPWMGLARAEEISDQTDGDRID
jgi:hypothetical protein